MRYLKRFEDLSDDYRETFRDTVWTFNSFRSVGGKVEKLTLRYLKTTNIVDFEYDMATITRFRPNYDTSKNERIYARNASFNNIQEENQYFSK